MRLTVVIPTFNRKEILKGCLDALCNQSLPPEEILVVDDGSTDGTAEMVNRRYKGVARALARPRLGIDHARNHGLQTASGELVVFTDDDTAASRDWLKILTAPFEDPAVMAVGGAVTLLWECAPPAAFLKSRRALECLGKVDCGGARKRLHPESGEFFTGANLALRKSLASSIAFQGVVRVPGFGVCADDYRLSRELARRHVVLYEPQARVEHRIPAHRARWGHILHRAFHYEAARAVLGGRLNPRRGPADLLGWEGAMSAAVTLGNLYGSAARYFART